eukprot:tig00020710_g13257.t1
MCRVARRGRGPSWAPLVVTLVLVVVVFSLLAACAEAGSNKKGKSSATGSRKTARPRPTASAQPRARRSTRVTEAADSGGEDNGSAPTPTPSGRQSTSNKRKAPAAPAVENRTSDGVPDPEPFSEDEEDVIAGVQRREQFGGAATREEALAAQMFPNLEVPVPDQPGPSRHTRHRRGPVPVVNATTAPAGELNEYIKKQIQQGIDRGVESIREHQHQIAQEQQREQHEAMQLKNTWLREFAFQLIQLRFQLKGLLSCVACAATLKASLKQLEELKKKIDIRDKGGDKTAEALAAVPEEHRAQTASMAYALRVAGVGAGNSYAPAERQPSSYRPPQRQRVEREQAPTAQRNGGACFRCNQHGHHVKDCTNPPRPDWREKK